MRVEVEEHTEVKKCDVDLYKVILRLSLQVPNEVFLENSTDFFIFQKPITFFNLY